MRAGGGGVSGSGVKGESGCGGVLGGGVRGSGCGSDQVGGGGRRICPLPLIAGLRWCRLRAHSSLS